MRKNCWAVWVRRDRLREIIVWRGAALSKVTRCFERARLAQEFVHLDLRSTSELPCTHRFNLPQRANPYQSCEHEAAYFSKRQIHPAKVRLSLA